MTIKKVQSEVGEIKNEIAVLQDVWGTTASQVKSVRSNFSELRDEIAVLQNNLESLRKMVSADMKKIVDVVNNK